MRQKRGSIQARRGKFRISYYVDGLRFWETFATEEEALRELAKRLADTAQSVPVSSKPNTVLFEELARDVINDYDINEFRSKDDQEGRYRLHILPVFGKRKAATITTAQIKAYHVRRKQEGATLGTICRELQLIKHTFLLARNESTPPKIYVVPHIPIPKEKNVRQGFFERHQIEAICRHLPAHLVPVAWFGYITGWRHQEVMTRCLRHVSFDAGTVRMEPGETKSDEGRTFPLVEELREVLLSVWPKKGPIFPNARLFTNNGQPIYRFDKAWTTACHKAGLPVRYIEKRVLVDPKDPSKGKRTVLYKNGPKKGQPILLMRSAIYFHDFRRTAYRNLLRIGTLESVAMKSVGWEDPDTARRYNITAQADLDVLRERYDQAAREREGKTENGARNGAQSTKTGTKSL